jgi:hypothetical protein
MTATADRSGLASTRAGRAGGPFRAWLAIWRAGLVFTLCLASLTACHRQARPLPAPAVDLGKIGMPATDQAAWLDAYAPLPTMGVVDAVRKADEHIRDQKLDVSDCFLDRVQFLREGKRSHSEEGKYGYIEGSCWEVAYIPIPRLAKGGQVWIYVYADGRVGHLMGL